MREFSLSLSVFSALLFESEFSEIIISGNVLDKILFLFEDSFLIFFEDFLLVSTVFEEYFSSCILALCSVLSTLFIFVSILVVILLSKYI